MNTAFYVGQLSHARLTPKPHRFSYQVFMPFVDVDAVETLTDNIPLWSRKRLAPARFVRSDFIGPQDMPISDAVKARILEATGNAFSGRVSSSLIGVTLACKITPSPAIFVSR